MLYNFLAALALVFVIEGILPFLSPNKWRQAMVFIARRSDKQLRKFGLASMIIGLVLMMLVHQFL